MINIERFNEILVEFKKDFPGEHWKGEKYKWVAVKWFQENWDINAPDFGAMFYKATEKAGNLLTSQQNFPRGMIRDFAKVDDEAVRAMFINLFDESIDVKERITKFRDGAEAFRKKHGEGIWGSHYQGVNAISTYLWLRYPDKYYIYKYSECKASAIELGSDFMPTISKKKVMDSFAGGKKLYDEVCGLLQQDDEMKAILQSSLTDGCYSDPQLKTLTIDFCFYISRYLDKEPNDVEQTPCIEEGETQVQYWFLNANPKIWSFSGIAVGEEQDYTLYNDNGNKRRVFQNFLDAKAGDIVIGYESTPVKQIVALAKISAEQDGEKLCFKKTENLANPIDYATLKETPQLENMEYLVSPQGSLFKLTSEEYECIMDLIREENPVAKSQGYEPYDKEKFLSEVYMTQERYDTLVHLLDNKMNVILQGAPGVGKTFTAKRLAYSIMGEKDDSRIEFVQFHQNYSYEDFIMGYKPAGDGFELKNGIFYRFCQKASSYPDKKFFFIIDEINRGNISKILGELMMLIEKDCRGTSATLAYNGLPFSVPKNLYIIGMMNTADRSLAMIDYALRRRFSFFDVVAGFNSKGFKKYQESFNNETFNELIDRVVELNKEITSDDALGAGFCIGHSYFCGQKECTDEWLREVVEYDIIPMLNEYWFDDKSKCQRWENNLRGVFNV